MKDKGKEGRDGRFVKETRRMKRRGGEEERRREVGAGA
jgi:hypothetical protein